MDFTNKKSVMVLFLAILAVLGHWNVWADGIYALGLNTTVCWLGFLSLLWWHNSQRNFKTDKFWLIPLVAIAVSFSVFENPWLKVISCFILPIATGIFYNYGQINNTEKPFWNFLLLKTMSLRSLMPLSFVKQTTAFITEKVSVLFRQGDSHLTKRILLGVIILIPIAIVVLMLLSSADANFAGVILRVFDLIAKNINWTIPAKILCISILTVLLFATLHTWNVPLKYKQQKNEIKVDDVIVGIVMGGVFAIYLLFLWLQLDNLIVNALPNDFSNVESLVKSGFWQLFFLSILNTVLFYVVYKNTGNVAQIILRLFIIASGLLLLSATWRMGLYVYWYGLSYEKFFASYTSVFALVIFVYLLVASMSVKRKDILCFIAFTALWSYSAATLMPIEKMIFHTNVTLQQQQGSSIQLRYLNDLSLDVASDVEEQFANSNQNYDWDKWLNRKRSLHCNRAWYEWRLSLLSNCTSRAEIAR